jgi:hypothetical protein
MAVERMRARRENCILNGSLIERESKEVKVARAVEAGWSHLG